MKVRIYKINGLFFPQWKDWFFWNYFIFPLCKKERYFYSLNEAIQFLRDYELSLKRNKEQSIRLGKNEIVFKDEYNSLIGRDFFYSYHIYI